MVSAKMEGSMDKIRPSIFSFFFWLRSPYHLAFIWIDYDV